MLCPKDTSCRLRLCLIAIKCLISIVHRGHFLLDMFMLAWLWMFLCVCYFLYTHLSDSFMFYWFNRYVGVPWEIAIACRKTMKLRWRIFSVLCNWTQDLLMPTPYAAMSMLSLLCCMLSFYISCIQFNICSTVSVRIWLAA